MTHVNELALIIVWTLQSHIIQGKIFSFVEQKPDFTNDICCLLENLSTFVNTSRLVDLEQTNTQLLFTCSWEIKTTLNTRVAQGAGMSEKGCKVSDLFP